ncbi:MAG: PilZ domain-containing protein [Desulfomonilia bacterium]|nr:PilZ domain-containing protein [Desulfomonilia bacterium]
MQGGKERRISHRVSLPDLSGTVEIKDSVQPITVVNASKEGVCITGVQCPEGSVVKLEIEPVEDIPAISLYCKVAWVSPKREALKKSGLSFLNTNKVLFKEDLTSFSRILESAQARQSV